jgi:hypothetical protein
MKHNQLKSIAHNIADSIGSGIGLPVGYYEMDVYGEAAKTPSGKLIVDMLAGTINEGNASKYLANAIKAYHAILPDFCQKQGVNSSDYSKFEIHFWQTATSKNFRICITDSRGKSSQTDYQGIPGKRVKTLDALGRLRPKTIKFED